MVLYFILLTIFAIICGIALFNIIYYLPGIYEILHKIYKLLLEDKFVKAYIAKVYYKENGKGNKHGKK